MSLTTRFAAVALILTAAAPVAPAQDGPLKRLARLVDRERRNDGFRPQEGYFDASPADEAAETPAEGSDPYGFAAILNGYRASAGLPPVAYDPGLSAWASRNNVAMCRRGLGHHINPNCFQNCGWNYTDAGEAAQGWMNSPGHRGNMLESSATRFGIAYGPGPYWTLNVR